MKKSAQFFGILTLVFVVFGLLCAVLQQESAVLYSQIHFGLGVLCLLLFLVGGGLQSLRGAALHRATGYGLGATLYSGLFVGVLVVANLYVLRNDPLHFDSTEQQVFTLAPQTQKVLGALSQPIIARGFFVGGEVPPETRELLDRMARASKSFSWQVVDPEKNPRATERYGISERDTLHFSFVDAESSREAKLVRDITEQSIVNSILKLTRGGAKKVYWIAGHGEGNLDDETEPGYVFLKEAIEGENVQVQKLMLGAAQAIPEDANAVLLMAPRKELLPVEREQIQKYLKGGGNMLLLNEPNTTDDVRSLVADIGLVVGRDIVLDHVLQMFKEPKVGVQPVIHSYASHPAMEDFTQSVILSTATSVRAKDSARRYVMELAFTGKSSWAETDVEAIFKENPTVTLPDDKDRGAVPIAAAYNGADRPGISEVEDPEYNGRVIVIGDADFVANINIRQLFNRDFFLNSLNWVLGEQERISIRERTLRSSTETLSASQFQRIFLFCGVLLPELVLVWGLSVWWMRRG